MIVPTLAMRLEAAAATLALRLLGALGPARASTLAGTVARIIGPLLPVSRVADRNLQRALPALDPPTRRRVIRAVWESLGRTAGELPHLAALQENTPHGPGWTLEGLDTVRALAERGGPAIFVSGHIGNWEMLPLVSARHGVPVAGFYRAAANPLVDALILRLRAAAQGDAMPMFAKGMTGARQALAHLRAGGFLALLMDQKMNDGIEARFFGQPAMTAPAAAAMALRYRCPVILSFVERTGPARFRIVVEPPLTLPSGNSTADILALTQAINDRLEAWIRERPESWLWLHRRWPKEGGGVAPRPH